MKKERWLKSDVSETQLNTVVPTMVADKYFSIFVILVESLVKIIFKKFLEDISPFCGATDTLVFNLW